MAKISIERIGLTLCAHGARELTIVVMLVLLPILPLMLAATSTVAQATAYIVDTLADTSGAGNCSLRDAINASNGAPTSGSFCATAQPVKTMTASSVPNRAFITR